MDENTKIRTEVLKTAITRLEQLQHFEAVPLSPVFTQALIEEVLALREAVEKLKAKE